MSKRLYINVKDNCISPIVMFFNEIKRTKFHLECEPYDIYWLLLISVNSVHNGLYKGKRYFHCAPGHGAMVKYNEVKPIKTPSKTPPVKNNYMFPSWEEVKTRRKQRNEKWVLQTCLSDL